MAASRVNIADFRRRDLKDWVDQASGRAGENRGEPKMGGAEPEGVAENPGVLDIGAARDRQHKAPVLRRLSSVGPGSASNLVRFNEPGVAVMRVKQTRAVESWPQDDYDHPPAA
jgi:hypothetical protein